jgi:hypothetical protein
VKAGHFEVLDLSVDGKLSRTGQTFDLGPASHGEMVFTPDGAVGLVVLDEGAIGVVRFDGSGLPQVVHAAYRAKFDASTLTMAPEGDRVYVLSAQWRSVGGGIYRAKINCDGSLTEEGLVAESQLPYAMSYLPSPPRAVVVAADLLDSKPGNDVHLLSWPPSGGVIAGASAFGDDEAIVSSAALTADSRYLLIADDNAFSATAGNRLAAVEILNGGLRAAQVLTGFTDPAAVVTSPYADTALVLGGESNTISILDYDPSLPTPFKLRGALSTSGTPLLPVAAVMIRRGSLLGRTLIVENLSLRQVQFEKGGVVREVESFSLGTDAPAIPGAMGVQP